MLHNGKKSVFWSFKIFSYLSFTTVQDKNIGFNSCDCINFLNILNFHVQGVSQLLKQSDWAQIQDFKWYHNDDYIYYWKVKR